MSSLYRRFFDRLPVRPVAGDGQLHLLSATEIATIRRRHRQAVAAAAALSVMGFLLYFLPVYLAPGLFPSATARVFGADVTIPWAELVWGVVLMVLEIYLLVLLNLWGVHEIAVATGLMGAHNKAELAGRLIDIGAENRHKGLLQYGIDPFLGLNPALLFAVNLLLRLKGFLGSKLLRYAVQRLLGRFAVREVLDFVGMPIYMAINGLSTHAVLHEAKVIIMGQRLIERLCARLPADIAARAGERELLYDTLRFIAVSKRDFHQNHYLLTKALVERHAIATEAPRGGLADYRARLARAPEALRRACVLLIVIGFILDGQVSWRERRRIRELQAGGVIEFSAEQVAALCDDFVRGAGVESLLDQQLLGARGRTAARAADDEAVGLVAAEEGLG